MDTLIRVTQTSAASATGDGMARESILFPHVFIGLTNPQYIEFMILGVTLPPKRFDP